MRLGATDEADELGPEPTDEAERDLWREERCGAVVLLCGLADDDAELLRRAAVWLGRFHSVGSLSAGWSVIIGAVVGAAACESQRGRFIAASGACRQQVVHRK